MGMKYRTLAILIMFSGALGSVTAQTWPDYHLTSGNHYTSYGVEIYDPATNRNLHVESTATLFAGGDQIDNIYDANQVYLSGGTVYATAIDAPDFTWNSGELYLNGGTHSTSYGLDIGSAKYLHLESGGELVQMSGLSISSGNELHLDYAGKLTVSNFNLTTSGFFFNEGGVLEVQGALSGYDWNTFSESDQHIILRGPAAGLNTPWLSLNGPSSAPGVRFSILDGAVVNADYVEVNSDDGLIEVSGAGSELNSANWLRVGGQTDGIDARFEIKSGGIVQCTDAVIGHENDGSVVLVSGAGSRWSISGELNMGGDDYSDNHSLTINSGAVVSSSNAVVGTHRSNANGVTIAGAGSSWTITDSLLMGRGDSSGNGIAILNGGSLSNGASQFGQIVSVVPSLDKPHKLTLTVSGTGSQWVNSGALTMGESIGTFKDNRIIIEDGGQAYIGGMIQIYQAQNNNGIFLNSGGKLTVQTNFNAAMAGFNFSTGATLNVEGELTGLLELDFNKRLEAVSVLGDLTVHGEFAPGSSPADVTLDGALTVASDGTLEMEIGGYLAGSEHDRLTVLDTATLDGTLDLRFLDGFAVTNGASFELFDWGDWVSGTFAAVSSDPLPAGLSWDTSELYTTGVINVIPEPASVFLVIVGGGLLHFRRKLRFDTSRPEET
jgi:T5SS/PEP-CTERM-associated repeat protein